LTASGNNNTIIFENCYFQVNLTGIGNRIIIIADGRKFPKGRNSIRIAGSDNYASIMAG